MAERHDKEIIKKDEYRKIFRFINDRNKSNWYEKNTWENNLLLWYLPYFIITNILSLLHFYYDNFLCVWFALLYY